jgi:hypothetical protein
MVEGYMSVRGIQEHLISYREDVLAVRIVSEIWPQVIDDNPKTE